MSGPTTLVIVAHGSPDPDWRRPVEALGDRIRELEPDVNPVIAYLEHTPPSLEAAIEALAHENHSGPIRVVPAFLSAGGRHLKHDLPDRVRALAERFPALRLDLANGALGSDAAVIDALARAALRVLTHSPSTG